MALALTAGWNVNFSSKTNDMSDVALSNIEALAKKENPEQTGDIDCIECINSYGQKGVIMTCKGGEGYCGADGQCGYGIC